MAVIHLCEHCGAELTTDFCPRCRALAWPLSRSAVTALVLSVISFVPVLGLLPGVVGFFVGLSALNDCDTGRRGRRLAITAILLCAITVIFHILLVVAIAQFDSNWS